LGFLGAPLPQKGLLPRYFSSSWSHAQFRLPAGAGGSSASTASTAAGASATAAAASAAAAPRSVVAFGAEPHTLLVAVANGTFHTCVICTFAAHHKMSAFSSTKLARLLCRCAFDPTAGGECTGGAFVRFLDAEADAEAAEAAAEGAAAAAVAAGGGGGALASGGA
jgi:hypothetical protein